MDFFFLIDSKHPLGRIAVKLAAFISDRIALAQRAKMIFGSQFILACVYAGPVKLLKSRGSEPATVLFRPAVAATNFQLLECRPNKHRQCRTRAEYQKIPAKLVPLAGGSICAFITNNRHDRAHYIVAAHRKNRTIASNDVVAKVDTLPTRRRDHVLQIGRGTRPMFRWNIGAKPWVSFLLITGAKQMITGIYSFLNQWRFPSVAKDVPYYYHDAKEEPKLKSGNPYKAFYMPVDQDGWIPYMAIKNFRPRTQSTSAS